MIACSDTAFSEAEIFVHLSVAVVVLSIADFNIVFAADIPFVGESITIVVETVADFWICTFERIAFLYDSLDAVPDDMSALAHATIAFAQTLVDESVAVVVFQIADFWLRTEEWIADLRLPRDTFGLLVIARSYSALCEALIFIHLSVAVIIFSITDLDVVFAADVPFVGQSIAIVVEAVADF